MREETGCELEAIVPVATYEVDESTQERIRGALVRADGRRFPSGAPPRARRRGSAGRGRGRARSGHARDERDDAPRLEPDDRRAFPALALTRRRDLAHKRVRREHLA